MALLPSLLLILGALILIPLRGRRSQLMSLISAGVAFVAVLVLSQRPPATTAIALWRPIELFGSGFLFSVENTVWPFLVLGTAVILSEALLDGRSPLRLLYAGIALAAITAGNLITILMLWTLMISMEMALLRTGSADSGASLGKSGAQLAAIVAVMAAAHLGESAAAFLVLAALLRSLGGSESRFPIGVAVLAPLGALVAVSRYSLQPPALPWIAGAVIIAVLIQTLFFEARLTSFALALTAAGLIAPPAAQGVAWVSVAAVLVATVGLLHLGGSRIAWGAVAAISFAFFVAPPEPELWVMAMLVTTALAAISRLQPRGDDVQRLGRIEFGAIAVLIASAVITPLSSGWLPSLGGALAASVGLAMGYALAWAHPALHEIQLPRAEAPQRLGRAIGASLSAAVRTTAEVLEGESAVLWILLVLLIAIIGLQVVAI